MIIFKLTIQQLYPLLYTAISVTFDVNKQVQHYKLLPGGTVKNVHI